MFHTLPHKLPSKPAPRPEPKVDPVEKQRRASEDFRFLALCASKGNMSMYQLLRDRSV